MTFVREGRERERGMRLGVHGMVTITISSMVTRTGHQASMRISLQNYEVYVRD